MLKLLLVNEVINLQSNFSFQPWILFIRGCDTDEFLY